MAPTILPQYGHLIRIRGATKLPAFRRNPREEKWTKNASPPSRLTHLLPLQHHHHSHPSHSLLSLGSGLPLSPPPLRLLFPLRSPPPSPSLSPMTITAQAASDPPQSSPTKTVRVVIKGRVQGVFYRDWTMENAKDLGLKGWVRNRRDGSVEALFSGNLNSVQEMEQRCRRGPPAAMVTALEVFPCSDDPGSGFQRKPTT